MKRHLLALIFLSQCYNVQAGYPGIVLAQHNALQKQIRITETTYRQTKNQLKDTEYLYSKFLEDISKDVKPKTAEQQEKLADQKAALEKQQAELEKQKKALAEQLSRYSAEMSSCATQLMLMEQEKKQQNALQEELAIKIKIQQERDLHLQELKLQKLRSQALRLQELQERAIERKRAHKSPNFLDKQALIAAETLPEKIKQEKAVLPVKVKKVKTPSRKMLDLLERIMSPEEFDIFLSQYQQEEVRADVTHASPSRQPKSSKQRRPEKTHRPLRQDNEEYYEEEWAEYLLKCQEEMEEDKKQQAIQAEIDACEDQPDTHISSNDPNLAKECESQGINKILEEEERNNTNTDKTNKTDEPEWSNFDPYPSQSPRQAAHKVSNEVAIRARKRNKDLVRYGRSFEEKQSNRTPRDNLSNKKVIKFFKEQAREEQRRQKEQEKRYSNYDNWDDYQVPPADQLPSDPADDRAQKYLKIKSNNQKPNKRK